MRQKTLRPFANITVIIFVCCLFNILVVSADIQGVCEIGYLDFEDGRMYNRSETLAVNSQNGRINLVTENDGNKAAGFQTVMVDKLGVEAGRLYFAKLPIDNSEYRISMRVKHLSGTNTDMVFENGFDAETSADRRIAYIRFARNNVLTIGNNWTNNYEPKAESENAIAFSSDKWYTLEGRISPETKTAKWYLNDVLFSEYTYSAEGVITFSFVQTFGSEEQVTNKNYALMIDDMGTGYIGTGTFEAEASIVADELSIRFTEYIKDFDLDTVTLTSAFGDSIKGTLTQTLGKRYVYTLNSRPSGGRVYTLSLNGLTSIFGNSMTKILNINKSPDNLSLSIAPSEIGAIFTDGADAEFTLTAKNSGPADMNVSGIVRVIEEDGEVLREDEISFGIIAADSSAEIKVKPRIAKRGLFTLETSIKTADSDTYLTESYPMSVIYSNGVLNPNMGVTAHYNNQYYTGLETFKEEVSLNAKAGLGLERDDMSWDLYEPNVGGVYSLTSKQKLLYDTLKENDITPYIIMHSGTWKDGVKWDAPIADDRLERYGLYARELAKETAEYSPIIEVTNEWNLEFKGVYDAEDYVKVLKEAYSKIKDGNPNAKVIGICAAVTDMEQFVEDCLYYGAVDYCDGISIHPYSWSQSPEEADIHGVIEKVREMLKKYNAEDKEIILSEYGWNSSIVSSCSEQLQAEYSVRGAALAGDAADALIWYEAQERDPEIIGNIQEQTFGMVRFARGTTPVAAKPIYVALSCYNSLVGDKKNQGTVSDEDGNYYCVYSNDENTVVQCWNDSGTGNVIIDTSILGAKHNYARLYDMYGNCEYIFSNGGSFTVPTDVKSVYLEVDNDVSVGVNVLSAKLMSAGREVLELDELVEGAQVSVEAQLYNNNADIRELELILAAYDGEGKLISVSYKSIEVGSGEYVTEKDDKPEITLPADTKNIKWFIWDDKYCPIITKGTK